MIKKVTERNQTKLILNKEVNKMTVTIKIKKMIEIKLIKD